MPREDFKHLLEYFGKAGVVLESDGFVVFHKPAGLETISQAGAPDMTALVREARAEAGLVAAHRLDRDTSGAQLFARSPAAERELTALFRQRLVDKTYLAFCLGVPRNRSGTINRRLSEWSGGRRPVRTLRTGGLEASTGYRVLAAMPPGPEPRACLIAFSPRQGRTHQIRVHAAAFGYPVLGDDQYGDRPANREAKRLWGLTRQALHSWRLAFAWAGGRVEATCPLSADLHAAARAVAGDMRGAAPADVLPPE